MSPKPKTALQRMDALAWWSSASDTVRRDMSSDAGGRRKRPMRWLPLLPMAAGAGLIACATAFAVSPIMYGIAAPMMGVAAALAINGPLGKPSIDDDEREAALRKNAFFFCLAILACANIIGGPMLLFTAALNGWAEERLYGVAFALFIANMTWFTSLPTLYASWNSPELSEHEA